MIVPQKQCVHLLSRMDPVKNPWSSKGGLWYVYLSRGTWSEWVTDAEDCWCREKLFPREDRQILVCLTVIFREFFFDMICMPVCPVWMTDWHPQNIGWDPIFEYQDKTYAEMDKEEKVSETGGSV